MIDPPIPVGAIVDVDALLGVIGASLVAGVGITATFAAVIFTATRAIELRRSGNGLAAASLAAIAALGVVGCLAAVVFGIHVMASK